MEFENLLGMNPSSIKKFSNTVEDMDSWNEDSILLNVLPIIIKDKYRIHPKVR